MPEMSRDEKKAIVKEAISEWLDAKYSAFGKWTLHGIAAAGLAATAYFLISQGWIK